MQTYTYVSEGKFELIDKPKPVLQHERDAIVNVETFCRECFFCKKGFVNNCTDTNGGWALGCRIDGGQAEYVRIPFADNGLNKIPDNVTDRQALLVGDVLATGYWAARFLKLPQRTPC